MKVTPYAGYHQLYVAPREHWPEYDLAQSDELIQIMPDRRGCIIITGVAMGPVTLDVELIDGPEDAATGWEESAGGRWISKNPCGHRVQRLKTSSHIRCSRQLVRAPTAFSCLAGVEVWNMIMSSSIRSRPIYSNSGEYDQRPADLRMHEDDAVDVVSWVSTE